MRPITLTRKDLEDSLNPRFVQAKKDGWLPPKGEAKLDPKKTFDSNCLKSAGDGNVGQLQVLVGDVEQKITPLDEKEIENLRRGFVGEGVEKYLTEQNLAHQRLQLADLGFNCEALDKHYTQDLMHVPKHAIDYSLNGTDNQYASHAEYHITLVKGTSKKTLQKEGDDIFFIFECTINIQSKDSEGSPIEGSICSPDSPNSLPSALNIVTTCKLYDDGFQFEQLDLSSTDGTDLSPNTALLFQYQIRHSKGSKEKETLEMDVGRVKQADALLKRLNQYQKEIIELPGNDENVVNLRKLIDKYKQHATQLMTAKKYSEAIKFLELALDEDARCSLDLKATTLEQNLDDVMKAGAMYTKLNEWCYTLVEGVKYAGGSTEKHPVSKLTRELDLALKDAKKLLLSKEYGHAKRFLSYLKSVADMAIESMELGQDRQYTFKPIEKADKQRHEENIKLKFAEAKPTLDTFRLHARAWKFLNAVWFVVGFLVGWAVKKAITGHAFFHPERFDCATAFRDAVKTEVLTPAVTSARAIKAH